MTLKEAVKLDAQLSARLRVAEKPGGLRYLAIFLAHSGDSWFWLLALPILWYFGDAYWKQRAILLIIVILVTAVLVMSLKFTIRRARPEGEWGNIYRKTDPHSFPSGHAARALLIGIIMLSQGPPWLGLILIIWGPLVGLARIAMGIHYLSDVLAGWLVGAAMAMIALNISPIFFY